MREEKGRKRVPFKIRIKFACIRGHRECKEQYLKQNNVLDKSWEKNYEP